MAVAAPAGIDRIDLAFGKYFGLNPSKICAGVHYGIEQPQFVSPEKVGSIMRRAERHWREVMPVDQDGVFIDVRRWLVGEGGNPARDPQDVDNLKNRLKSRFMLKTLPGFRYTKLLGATRDPRKLPQNAIYLNVAQHAFEFAPFFNWISRRPDVQCVFFVHDLLPLDYPEFWPAGHETIFEKRVATMARHATALLTTSTDVRDRLGEEMIRRGRPSVPILAETFPSPFREETFETCYDPKLFRQPYFVLLGTIEPRKNHLLLLNIWRELAQKSQYVPKLVVVGRRGWENEQTIDILERSPAVAPHVAEISNIATGGLCRLLANARAVLMPSFAEGYGLPLVEAIGLKTPVIASDIAVLRQTAQGRAIFRHPLDGLGWMDAIQKMADVSADEALAERASVPATIIPGHEAYFKAVEDFLARL
jgi:glycosyltransferase involved in cell wall biosynthesis